MNKELYDAFPDVIEHEQFDLVLGTFIVANHISRGICQVEQDLMFFPDHDNPLHGKTLDFTRRTMYLNMGGPGETTPMPDWLSLDMAGRFIDWLHRDK